MENENLAQIIGKNLSSLRKAKGLTQQELAREINYSDKSISKWELGYAIPAVDVLKDFALYYGVTIDYLVQEQAKEDLEKIATFEKRDDKRTRINKAIFLAMTITFIVLVAICIFFSEYYFSIDENRYTPNVFVWMVPITFFIAALETQILYRNKIAVIVLMSVFVWTFLLSFAIQFQFFTNPPENVWYLLVVGAPIQVILVLMRYIKFK